METISISKLKANLSAEIKKVRKGTRIMILDHNHPVAELIPIESECLFASEASIRYSYAALKPLTDTDPARNLQIERSDRW